MQKTLLTDLQQKYDQGIVYKAAPISKRKSKYLTEFGEDFDEEEELRVHKQQIYKYNKYKYSLFNPKNVKLVHKHYFPPYLF